MVRAGFVLVVALLVASSTTETMAARKRHHGPRAGALKPAVMPYAPQTRQYAVVIPRDGHASAAAAEGEISEKYPWRQVNVGADPYPWGWFGARWHPETSSHRSYYGDYKDWKFSRGY